MADWGTRAGTLTNIHDHYETAKEKQQAIADRTTWMMVEADAANWQMAFFRCNEAFEFVRSALSSIYYIKSGAPLEFALTYFLETYTIESAVEFNLTWDKITAAWIDAPKDGRLMTILTLDELRRDRWFDEVGFFKIAEAPY